MPRQTERMCNQCGKRRAQDYSELCASCTYRAHVAFMSRLESDDQDWEFTVCPECGSPLDGDGICRNQMCGASPDVGKDWI